MLIEYCSDFTRRIFKEHLFFIHSNKFVRKADILVLAGDIYPFSKNTDNVSFFDFNF